LTLQLAAVRISPKTDVSFTRVFTTLFKPLDQQTSAATRTYRSADDAVDCCVEIRSPPQR
jgi:hypothetical protein